MPARRVLPPFFCLVRHAMHRSLVPFLLVLAVIVPVAAFSARSKVVQEPHYSRISRAFASRFPREHLTHTKINDKAASQAWTNYLATLDSDRIYFLESDIKDFRRSETALDNDLKKGNLDFAYDTFAVFKKRFKERHDFVFKLLEKELDLDGDEVFEWDRRDAAWAKNKSELNDLWRKRIKNQYIQILVSRALADATPTKITKITDDTSVPGPEPVVLSPADLITKRYAQTLTILQDNDAEWVLQRYLSAFAHAFDPHSGYMSPSSMDDFNIEMQLSLVGIGALLSAEDGAAKVLRLIPGGPAARDTRPLRLRPDDKIIAVAQGDGPAESILHWPLYKTVKKIRGKKGTRVVLTVIPASDPSGSTTKKVDLVRDEVRLDEQAVSSRTREITQNDGSTLTLGIIHLPTFYANLNIRSKNDPSYRSCAHDIRQALMEMVEKDVDGILLDLRNNGGGALLEAVKMAGLFIERGPVVQVRERYRTHPLLDPDPDIVYSGPLVVLVNRVSASASEILAGALQDYGRAIIVGDIRTHGKGTVQTILNLGRDKRLGSLRVTTAGYYRITGRSTQVEGVSADIVVPSRFNDMKMGEEYLQSPVKLARTREAVYTRIDDLGSVIPLLRDRSRNRRTSNPVYAAYLTIQQRITKNSVTKQLSLNLERRIEIAREDKRISLLLPESADDDTENTGKADPVLAESLQILSDFVSMKKRGMLLPASAPESPTSPSDGTSKVPRRWLAILALLVLVIFILPITKRSKK